MNVEVEMKIDEIERTNAHFRENLEEVRDRVNSFELKIVAENRRNAD
jgi:hypothetical protein